MNEAKLNRMMNLVEGKLDNIPPQDLQEVYKDIKEILENPLDLAVYYETQFQLTTELKRDVDPESSLFKKVETEIKEYYSIGEPINEMVVEMLEKEYAFKGDLYEFWTDDLPPYMFNPKFTFEMEICGNEVKNESVSLEGFYSKEEIKSALEKKICAEANLKTVPDGGLAFHRFEYCGRDKQLELPDLFKNRKKAILALLTDDTEEIFTYSSDYCEFYGVRSKNESGFYDRAANLEDTFHRIVDEYGEENVHIMGAEKDEDDEILSACPLDLGYVVRDPMF